MKRTDEEELKADRGCCPSDVIVYLRDGSAQCISGTDLLRQLHVLPH